MIADRKGDMAITATPALPARMRARGSRCLSASLLLTAILASVGTFSAMAQANSPGASAGTNPGGMDGSGAIGEVVQSFPRRMGDRVAVDYALRIDGDAPASGTLLTALRPTRYGREVGPPYDVAGYVVVTAPGNGQIRAVPLPPAAGDKSRVSPGVPMVGDLVRRETSLAGVAPTGAGVELNKLFPQANNTLAPEAQALVPELIKTFGKPEQLVVVVYHTPSASSESRGLAWSQAQALANRIQDATGLDESRIHPLIMPLAGEGQPARAEVRAIPTGRPGNPSK